MALIKKEVLVKGTSTMTLDSIKAGGLGVVNSFQNATANKKNGAFIDYFFADIFDSRNNNLYRIYSSACEAEYNLTKVDGYLFFEVIIQEKESNSDSSTTFILD